MTTITTMTTLTALTTLTMQALGALTKGDRRAADASDLSAFDVDTVWGMQA